MTEFFASDDPEHRQQLFFTREELPDVGAPGVCYRLVGARRRNRSLCVMHETYGPAADTGEEMISHSGEEAGVVIRGSIEITVGDECRVLGAGDAYYFDTSTPHRMKNVGSGECEIVSASTPPTY